MKLSLSLCLLLLSLTTPCFAICEQEQERAQKNRELCNQWCDISGITTTVGAAVGGCAFGPLGALGGGASGLVPGTVAYRICQLADEKDKILKECQENHAAFLKRQEEEAQAKKRELQIQAAGKILGKLYAVHLTQCLQKYDNEFQALIDRYIDSGEDIKDPAVIQKIKQEAETLKRKYF